MNLNIIIVVILAGGWLSGRLFKKIQLPSVLGMTLFGIAVSFWGKHLIPETLWEIAPFLKSLALVVILLRAGLGIQKAVLKKVGRTALLMALIPCLMEAGALTLCFYYWADFPLETAALTAFLIAAVSPAVVVPSMLEFKEKGLGQKKEIPTMILAGASLDDVFAITLFTLFLGVVSGTGESSAAEAFWVIPYAVIGGIVPGVIAGFLLAFWFNRHHDSLRATEKALILLVLSLFLFEVGDRIQTAALLGVMTAGFVLLEKAEKAAHETAAKLNKAWVFAEIILFVIIGMSVNVEVALEGGVKGAGIIFIGLLFRSLGVMTATVASGYTMKERLFCVISYLPKATVQAALGAAALDRGVAQGESILAVAVLAIVITAPLGLLGIKLLGPKLLKH